MKKLAEGHAHNAADVTVRRFTPWSSEGTSKTTKTILACGVTRPTCLRNRQSTSANLQRSTARSPNAIAHLT